MWSPSEKTCASMSATKSVRINGGMPVIRKHRLQENCSADTAVVRRRGRPHKISMARMSSENVPSKCIVEEEEHADNGKEDKVTDRLLNVDEVVGTSGPILKHDRSRKRHDTSVNGLNVSFRRKHNRHSEYQDDTGNKAGTADGYKSETACDMSTTDQKFANHIQKHVSSPKAVES